MPLLCSVALAIVCVLSAGLAIGYRPPDRRVAVLWREVLILWDRDDVTRARLKALETTVGNLKANALREIEGHHGWLTSLRDDARAAERRIGQLARLVDGQGDRLDRLDMTATACADALGRFAAASSGS